MTPIKFEEANVELQAPSGQPDVNPLWVYRDGEVCLSAWRPDWRERLAILFGKPIWLGVWSGHTQPPVLVTTDCPLEKQRAMADTALEQANP